MHELLALMVGDREGASGDRMKDALRNAVRIVALLNIAYFGVEFITLFADSIEKMPLSMT